MLRQVVEVGAGRRALQQSDLDLVEVLRRAHVRVLAGDQPVRRHRERIGAQHDDRHAAVAHRDRRQVARRPQAISPATSASPASAPPLNVFVVTSEEAGFGEPALLHRDHVRREHRVEPEASASLRRLGLGLRERARRERDAGCGTHAGRGNVCASSGPPHDRGCRNFNEQHHCARRPTSFAARARASGRRRA